MQPKHYDDIYGVTLAGGIQLTQTAKKTDSYFAFYVGPTLLSDDKFGKWDLGSKVLFAFNIALGVSFGKEKRHALEGFATHYSHGELFDNSNAGFDIYGLAYRYSF